jgi:outer membrane biosynthesis protein TonB
MTMTANKILFLSVGLLIVFALSLAVADDKPADAPMDPAVQTAPAPTEAAPGTAPAPAPVPESKPAEVAPAPAPAPEATPAPAPETKPAVPSNPAKKSKKVNKTRKVKTACDIMDKDTDGKKVGSLKVGTPIWTDEHSEGWVKVYRKNSVGFVKTDCFE